MLQSIENGQRMGRVSLADLAGWERALRGAENQGGLDQGPPTMSLRDMVSQPEQQGNYMRNNTTGAVVNFDSQPQGQGQLPDYAQPIEIAGYGKGYRSKTDPFAVILNDGRTVQTNVDRDATMARQRQALDMDYRRQQLQGAQADTEGRMLQNRMTLAQLRDLQGGNESDAPAGLLANQLGVPAAPEDPLRGLSRKARERFQTTMYQVGDKQVAETEQEARAAQQFGQDAKRFKELNKNTTTGPLMGSGPVGFVRKIGNSDLQEMDAISSKLIPKMREPGSGNTSDFDARMFGKATIGIDKDKKANDSIALGLIAKSQLDQDRSGFMRS